MFFLLATDDTFEGSGHFQEFSNVQFDMLDSATSRICHFIYKLEAYMLVALLNYISVFCLQKQVVYNKKWLIYITV